MAKTAAPSTTRPPSSKVAPGRPNFGPGFAQDAHGGPSFSRQATVSVRSAPQTTRSGELAADQTVRPITRNAPDGTNARKVDRGMIDASVYARRYS